MEMNVGESRGRREPKKRWLDVNKSDMRAASVCVDSVRNRIK